VTAYLLRQIQVLALRGALRPSALEIRQATDLALRMRIP
jgi:hypothetical protein